MDKQEFIESVNNLIERLKHEHGSHQYIEVAMPDKSTIQFDFTKRIKELITNQMSKRGAKEEVFKIFQDIVQNLNEALSSIGPLIRPRISDEYKTKIVQSISGLTPKEFVKMLNDTLIAPGKMRINMDTYTKNPAYLALAGWLIYGYNSLFTKEELKLTLYLQAIILYPNAFFSLFPHDPNKDVMTYTLNNLPNSFFIRKMGSIGKLLLYDAESSFRHHSTRFQINGDWEYINFVNRLRTTISANIKKIARRYYDDFKKGNRITSSDAKKETEGGNTSVIDTIVNNTIQSLITYGPDRSILEQVCISSQLSPTTLGNFYSECVSKQQYFRDYLSTLVSRFFAENAQENVSVKSSKFYLWAKDLHKKISSEVYKKLKILLTKISMRDKFANERTVYQYISGIHKLTVLMIMKYN